MQRTVTWFTEHDARRVGCGDIAALVKRRVGNTRVRAIVAVSRGSVRGPTLSSDRENPVCVLQRIVIADFGVNILMPCPAGIEISGPRHLKFNLQKNADVAD